MSIWNPFQKDRDLQQIEQLYRQYREPLWRYAYKLLHDEHLAQDVVQSVFIKAIEKSQLISSLDCNKAKAYFVIMVRNLSYTLYRQQKRHPAIPFEGLEELFADTDDDPEQTLIRRCEQEQVHQALEQLHESYRDVLSMKYLYSMSDEEIASVLNIKPASVREVDYAKADGVDVTAETCTHYLTFTDRDARRCGAVMKTYPLIRTAADRQAVWQGLADGTLDWVCSDHAPHTCEEKHRSFWDAPAGISGIEGLSPVLLTAVHRGLLTLPRVAAITSANAARTFGLYPRKGVIRPGADADLAIVDMSAAYTFRQEKMYSKAKWSPYDGMSFQGRVVETILRGRTTMRDGQVLPDCFGQFLPVCTK